MANINEHREIHREAVERHKDNRVTVVVAGLIIVVAMIAALAFLMNRDRLNSDANTQQATATAQQAGAQAEQANANAATANLQAQTAAANAAAAHGAAAQGAERNNMGADGSGGTTMPSQEVTPTTESTPSTPQQ